MLVHTPEATQSNGNEMESSICLEHAQRHQIWHANFQDIVARGHVHATESDTCFGRMMQIVLQKLVTPAGMEQESVSEVKEYIVSYGHPDRVKEVVPDSLTELLLSRVNAVERNSKFLA